MFLDGPKIKKHIMEVNSILDLQKLGDYMFDTLPEVIAARDGYDKWRVRKIG